MDIRNYFGSSSSTSTTSKSSLAPHTPSPSRPPKQRAAKATARTRKKKTVTVSDEESDQEDPIPSKVAKAIKKAEPKKRVHVINDSDDDLPAGASATPRAAKAPKVAPVKRSASPKLTKINPDDFFGKKKDPVKDKRKESPVEQKRSTSSGKKSPDVISLEQESSPKRQPAATNGHTKAPKVTVEVSPKVSVTVRMPPNCTVRMSPRKTTTNANETTPTAKPVRFSPRRETPKIETPRLSPQKAQTVPHMSPKKHVTPPVKKPLEFTAIRSPPQKAATISSPAEQTNKRQSHGGGPGYHQYLQREGPQHIGEKEIPTGAENCLRGLTFVLTGVLDSIERDDCKALIEKHAGKVTTSVSRKTSYVVVGRDAGQSKLNKIREWNLKQLDEDGLFDMIRKSAPKPDPKQPKSPMKPAVGSPPKPSKIEPNPNMKTEQLLWVDKYKPTTVKQIIGQQGDKSPVNKLLNWLRNWHRWHLAPSTGKKAGKSDDGSSYKAALLSGIPGIGKTTSAHLCCKELGLSVVELNASDVRSKKSLEQHVMQLVGNKQLDQYFSAESSTSKRVYAQNAVRHVLIMDEVDGMSGNEDRAGMQELIALIKSTKIPIICICNDRQSQKVRSLANYCFDLRFYKPRLEQIRGRLMSIAAKEGIKMNPQSMDQLIEGANHDIRQVIQKLNLMSADQSAIGFDQARNEARNSKKDVTINIFEAARRVLAGGREISIMDKTELFFMDYSLMPLFMQENYLRVVPHGAKTRLDRISTVSDIADSLCWGDVAGRMIRSHGAWGLLNEQCMFSTVLPSERLTGYMQGQLVFPSWLGKNSSRGKRSRQLQQLQAHMCLHISSDVSSLQMDYLPLLRAAVTKPLIDAGLEGVKEVVRTYEAYDLTREDTEAINELALWPDTVDPFSQIQSKVKAAVTRTYNKDKHRLPFVTGQGATAKRKRGPAIELTEFDEMGNLVEDTAEESDDDKDDGPPVKMTKLKETRPTKSKAKTSRKK